MKGSYLCSRLYFTLGLILFFLTSAQAQKYLFGLGEDRLEPARNIIQSDANSLVVEYIFNEIKITDKRVNNTTYQYVHIGGFKQMTEIGKPAMPAHTYACTQSATVAQPPRGAT